MADNANTEKPRDPGFRPGGGRRNSGRRRSGKSKPRRFPSAGPETVQVCPLCGQNVRDILTAISMDGEGTPAHFDCVLKKISAQEELKNREKVCYLGKGEFGVVRFKGNNGGKFEIVKRVTVEPTDKPISWRKEIAKRLKR